MTMTSKYRDNLKVLKARWPQVAALVAAAPDTVTRKGQQLAYRVNGTQTLYFPKKPETAKETASSLLTAPQSLILYSGCGAGHVPRLLAKELPEKTHLLLQERSPAMFKGMLQAFDCRHLLTHPRVTLAVGDVPLAPLVQDHFMRRGHDIQIAQDQEQWAVFPDYAQSVNGDLMTFMQDFTINFNTLVNFGPLFAENCLRHIPAYLTSQGLDVLGDQFAGIPAVIVGGGPSLAKNVEVLRAVKGKGLIICADTVLKYLLERGIAPDFVVSVDPQDRTFTKYQDLVIPDETALVYHPGCRWEIGTTWPRDKYHTGTGMSLYSWMDWLLGKRVAIDGNIHCQVHLGCNLAVHLGCKPIALVGMDLCFTDNRYHAPGASYLSRDEEDAHIRGGMDLTDIYGQPVKTVPIFLNYRHLLEARVKEHPNRFVYATEGGIGVPGMPNAPLMAVVNGFGIGRYVQVADRRRWCHQFATPPCPDLLREEGWRRVYDLVDAEHLAKKTLAILDSPRPMDVQARWAHALLVAMKQKVAGLGLLQLHGSEEDREYRHTVVDHLDRYCDPMERFQAQRDRARLWCQGVLKHSDTVECLLREALKDLGNPIPRTTYNRWMKGEG